MLVLLARGINKYNGAGDSHWVTTAAARVRKQNHMGFMVIKVDLG
jgi:hypothetical protein